MVSGGAMLTGRSARGSFGRRRASLGLAVLAALIGACRLATSSLFVVGGSAGPLSRRGVAMEAARAQQVQIKLGGAAANLEVVRRGGDDSEVKVVSGNLPLGLKITMVDGGPKVGDTFVVQEVLRGGAASLGEMDVRAGDIIHGVTTTVSGKKGALQTHDACSSVDELSQAILGNDDGSVSLVIERPEIGGSGLEWMQQVGSMF
mmetsp:Transcript_78374/g.196788  ORF Transcript_78374/g.196788 Transcript_78374/m.196788 type:complete len:204 (+) Transcript_78374:42-653(+)